jgi:hypothetical protein
MKLGISNNNIGGAILLIFILLLSQSRILDLFINSALGRIALIVFLLTISYMNKTLGVISVLSFILVASNSGWFVLEGLENKEKEKKESSSAPNLSRSIEDIKNELAAAVAANAAKEPDSEPVVATEGFDLIGTERELQNGKRSNSIGVNKFSQNYDLVYPGEGNIFSNFFSVFN